MQLTSVLLLALSTVALVRADTETYTTCLAEFTDLVLQTGYENAHTISTTGINSGKCKGCPWQCIAAAYGFATAEIPRPVVANGAFHQQLRKCLGKE